MGMKNTSFPVLLVCMAALLAACGGSPATINTGTSPLATPAASPTIQPRHDYLVYGVKTVVYSMSDYDANQQQVPLHQYIDQHTDIFSYSMETQATTLIFSDKALPVFILNTSGGGETAIHDIVATDPGSGKIYARMMPRNQYNSYDDAGGLYELSTDGTNQYKKLFDFYSPDNFVLSPDATKIASLSNSSLVVRALPSGEEISRVTLEAFKDNWISAISWAPDGKTLLMDVAAGEASVTPALPYSQTVGSYLVNISDKSMQKMSAPIFQSPLEVIPGYMTDPASFVFFPRSNQAIGMARKYDSSSYSVELLSVNLDGSNQVEIPIGNNESVWEFIISPDEQYIAYPCMQNICTTHLPDSASAVASQAPTAAGGAEQEQTVIGWLEK